jgi:hypothetical protein
MQRSASAGTELPAPTEWGRTIQTASRIASATAMAFFAWSTS